MVELFLIARFISKSCTLSVSVQPGNIELKRIPRFPNSRASDLVKPTVAAQTLLDSIKLGEGCFTEIDVIVRTDGLLDFCNAGKAARINRT